MDETAKYLVPAVVLIDLCRDAIDAGAPPTTAELERVLHPYAVENTGGEGR